MFIGEAPGAEEDRQGKPFVGRAGQLLDKMLAAIGLDRKTNAYITNVLNWRPPGNRDPSPEEAATCLPFLRRHIELVAPEIIVLLGATAARHVTGRTDGIMRLRGQWLEYFAAGKMVPVMPTLHPAYLLRQPAHKKLAWRDLQAIEDKVKSLGLLEPAVKLPLGSRLLQFRMQNGRAGSWGSGRFWPCRRGALMPVRNGARRKRAARIRQQRATRDHGTACALDRRCAPLPRDLP